MNSQMRKRSLVHNMCMGTTFAKPGKVEVFAQMVKKEGVCDAWWDVPGKLAHHTLAKQLRAALPQYEFELDYYGYLCRAYRDDNAKQLWSPDPGRPIGY